MGRNAAVIGWDRSAEAVLPMSDGRSYLHLGLDFWLLCFADDDWWLSYRLPPYCRLRDARPLRLITSRPVPGNRRCALNHQGPHG